MTTLSAYTCLGCGDALPAGRGGHCDACVAWGDVPTATVPDDQPADDFSDVGPAYHAPGHCRNCGQPHHIQKCSEILDLLTSCEIPLANGKGIAIVDRVDYDVISRFSWHLHSEGYATTHVSSAKAYMHHFIIKNIPAGHVVDHINRNKLDNRRSNLRIAHFRHNAYNSKNREKSNKSSEFRGVMFCARADNANWCAQIRIDGKRTVLGHFQDEIEAARAYDAAAREHHGEFATLNFPDPDPDPNAPIPAVRTTARQWLADDWRRDALARQWSERLRQAADASCESYAEITKARS